MDGQGLLYIIDQLGRLLAERDNTIKELVKKLPPEPDTPNG